MLGYRLLVALMIAALTPGVARGAATPGSIGPRRNAPTASWKHHGDDEDEPHSAPHGGVVVSTADGHVEVRLERPGRIVVWVLDTHERPVSARGATGSARLAVPGAADVPLAYNAALDALVANVALPATERVVGIVTVTRPSARPATARFVFEFAPRAP